MDGTSTQVESDLAGPGRQRRLLDAVRQPALTAQLLQVRAQRDRRRGPQGHRYVVPRRVQQLLDAPRAGVGAVVLDGDRVLLVRRGAPPSQGKWSIPGGLIHLGERIEDAVIREVQEECGLRVRILGLCGVIDRVVLGPGPSSPAAVRYHYVIVDYVATVIDGRLCAGSDAAEARWVPLAELARTAVRASFAPEDVRSRVLGEIDAYVADA